MRTPRRAVLRGLAAVPALAVAQAFAGRALASAPPVLRAAPATWQLAPSEYAATPVWAYGGTVPGPLIRVRRHERVRYLFENGLDEPSTVHWHGIRLENAMDGVPGLTQHAVEPGQSFLYDFAADDAGTYWYHPHVRSWEQVARGLHGVLIVDETEPVAVDRDEVLLIDDWRLEQDATIHESFGSMHDRAHAGRLGNWVTVNGDGAFVMPVEQGERLRLRLVNAATARVFDLEATGLAGWVVALDGQPLDTPAPLARFALAPAQRVDLIVDVTAEAGGEALLTSYERDGSYAAASFPVVGTKRSEALGEPSPLPANDVPALGDLAAARRVALAMAGGAMGPLRKAELDGRLVGIEELVQAGKAWAFNGSATPPKVPLVTAEVGQTVRIAMTNDSRWPHAMHLHGHHFRKVSADGTTGPLRDTLLLAPDEQAEIAFVADNPGDWLLHCHMLDHAVAGMSTWLRVQA